MGGRRLRHSVPWAPQTTLPHSGTATQLTVTRGPSVASGLQRHWVRPSQMQPSKAAKDGSGHHTLAFSG